METVKSSNKRKGYKKSYSNNQGIDKNIFNIVESLKKILESETSVNKEDILSLGIITDFSRITIMPPFTTLNGSKTETGLGSDVLTLLVLFLEESRMHGSTVETDCKTKAIGEIIYSTLVFKIFTPTNILWRIVYLSGTFEIRELGVNVIFLDITYKEV